MHPWCDSQSPSPPPRFLQLKEHCHYLDDWASAGMSGQWIIAAQGCLFSCHGRRSHHCCSSVPGRSPREERWERAAGEQHLCPAGKRRCRMVLATPCSRSGHHFCSLLLLPTDFTTSLHRLIGQMLKLCDLIMQNIMFWNEQFILESADWKSFDFTSLLNTRLSFIVYMAFLFMTKYSCS